MNAATGEIDLRASARALRPELVPSDHLVESARKTWRGRMINEYSSATVFDGLAAHMAAARFERASIADVRAFAGEERRHGALCGAVLEALGGEARFLRRIEGDYPDHSAVSPIEGVLRNVISISCLSETVAVSLIGAERIEMPSGELHDLLTEIYADEVGHARFGWRLVEGAAPHLDADTRRRLGEYLVIAFAHLERHELAHLPENGDVPVGGESLGLCSGRAARELFYDTVKDVIVPGLERLGLSANAAWRARHEAPTSAVA